MVSAPSPSRGTDVTVCYSYNAPKAVVALIQAIYGSVTLFRARGDQIKRYGYVAFGLTVIPYVIMSVLNWCGALLLPDFPTLYIVRSRESDDAISLGGQIDGAIGRVLSDDEELAEGLEEGRRVAPQGNHHQGSESHQAAASMNNHGTQNLHPTSLGLRRVNFISPIAHIYNTCLPSYQTIGTERWSTRAQSYTPWIVAHIFGGLPFAIIGLFTHFHPGQSTEAQR